MLIQKINENYINVAYMVKTTAVDRDNIRVTMLVGDEFDGFGDDARSFIERLEEIAANPMPGVVTTHIPRPKPAAQAESGLREQGA